MIAIILALFGRLRRDNHSLEANLSCIVILSPNKTKQDPKVEGKIKIKIVTMRQLNG
jgi:hypothetical protein